jgi:hypothetical protein
MVLRAQPWEFSCVLEFETEAGETGVAVYFFFSHKSMKGFAVR